MAFAETSAIPHAASRQTHRVPVCRALNSKQDAEILHEPLWANMRRLEQKAP